MQKPVYYFKEVFARIWATWGLVTFVITFLVIFIPSMCSWLFKDFKKGQAYFIWVSRVWMRVWLTLIGCPVFVHGKENFQKGENYIICFNHNTFMDVPLSAPFVEGANKTIAKASFTRVPLFGLFYTRGSVLVNRNSDRSRIKSFEKMKKVLADGMHMCIYPEGTRNRTGEPLKAFHDGAFKLSVGTGKKVLPCVIKGTREALPIHKTFYLVPTFLHMYYLPAIDPNNKKVAELKQTVYTQMENCYIEKTQK